MNMYSDEEDEDESDQNEEFDPNHFYSQGYTLQNNVFFVLWILKCLLARKSQIE